MSWEWQKVLSQTDVLLYMLCVEGVVRRLARAELAVLTHAHYPFFPGFPVWSNTRGVPMTLMPLSAVLFFEGVLAALEDRKRHQRDTEMNNTKTTVIKKNGAMVETCWANVRTLL